MPGFSHSLAGVAAGTFRGRLVRAVASQALFPPETVSAPNFLFTSGKPNRYNLAGTECLYMAEEDATALAEYRSQFTGLAHGSRQPVTLFYARVRLSHILDLTDEATRRALGVTLKALEASWTLDAPPTTAQRLGEAVARQSRIRAIRYRSVAAAATNQTGHNWVIFKACLRQPDFVCILGPTEKPLQKWP